MRWLRRIWLFARAHVGYQKGKSMFNYSTKSSWIATSLIFGLLSGCGGGSNSDASSPEPQSRQPITLTFAARVGEHAIECEQMENTVVGTSNVHPEFKDARLYLSDIQLIDQNGETTALQLDQDGKWQYQNVALLDFETGADSCANGNVSINTQIRGHVPQGDYSGVRFTLGVPTELNHFGINGDDAVSPLDVMGMNWSWQNGHKHLRLDVDGWNIHLGTTGCEVIDSENEIVDCATSRPNRPVYQFDHYRPAEQIIVFDYQKLVASSDIAVNTTNTPPGCMSSSGDPDCQGIFDSLGLDLVTGQCLNDDCSSAQTWVSVE